MHNHRLALRVKAPLKQDQSYVLYWMQQSQRIHDNFALEAAMHAANQAALPLRVLFVLTPDFKEANQRHYAFMLEGIKDLMPQFVAMGIDFMLEVGSFSEVVMTHATKANGLFMDKAYLKPLRRVRDDIVKQCSKQSLRVIEVDSDVIVPVDIVSQKCEYAARTIRPKLLRLVDEYLDESVLPTLLHQAARTPSALDDSIEQLLMTIKADDTVKKSSYFLGGETEGLRRLDDFVKHRLPHYHISNDPSSDYISQLSPYLHFGQLSATHVYREVLAASDYYLEGAEAYLEQLLVRRELAFNFVYYCDGYDHFETMSHDWAYGTMAVHDDDARPYLYTEKDYITFKTHDPYFNAAMKEMVITGHMHNTMRMYWGKKIIEWSPNHKSAYETILTLNNRYFIDGRDPNSYAGVAWLFGRHDRPWGERDVFGKLRYMNDAGLKRKYDIEHYVAYANNLVKR